MIEPRDIHIVKSLFNDHIRSVKNRYDKIIIEYFEKHKSAISEFDMIFVNQFMMSSVKNYKNYSNTLLFNHNDNQIIFNIIFNHSIEQVIEYLSKTNAFFKGKLDFIREHEPIVINHHAIHCLFKTSGVYTLQYESYYSKIIFVFLFYIGFQRRLVHFLQNTGNYKEISAFKNDIMPGKIADLFHEYEVHYMYHTFGMIRFINNDRIKYYVKQMYAKRNIYRFIEEPIEVDGLQLTSCQCMIWLHIPEDFFVGSRLDARFYMNYPNSYLYIQYLLTEDKEPYFTSHYTQPRKYGLGNISLKFEDLLHLFDLLGYCLHLLDHENELEQIMGNRLLLEKKLFTILLFYYVYIFIMPYKEGTACIAEISMHSLLKKYLNPNIHLVINPKIMMDVEALCLPFIDFYNNCFNNTDGTEYTPYFTITNNN